MPIYYYSTKNRTIMAKAVVLGVEETYSKYFI